jgi:8-oxo-dGTP pyrophosphatase MutT (NUDIX family)
MTTQHQIHDDTQKNRMITFDRGNLRFSYRVAGVAIRDGKVLVQEPLDRSFCFLPGGRAELQESAGETLRREMQEELHVDVTVGRLLWVVENFFEHGGKTFHELGLYFLLTFPDDSPIVDTSKTFSVQEGLHEYAFRWQALDGLDSIQIYPSFLQTALQSLPAGTEHIVHVDT